MRHNDDRVGLLQAINELFDFPGGYRIQRGTGFIHEDNFRLHRQRAGDTEPLLLAAGKSEGAVLKAVLHFLPETRSLQTVLHQLVQRPFVFGPMQTRPIGHVIVDRFGKGV